MSDLLDKIRDDMITARKNGDVLAKSLLVTLFAEASRLGKDRRNGDPTDEEVVSTVRKFITNAEDTSRLLLERSQSTVNQQTELAILKSYLPQQMDVQELKSAIEVIVDDLKLQGPKSMGQVMAELKNRHAGCYDGKQASVLVKAALT